MDVQECYPTDMKRVPAEPNFFEKLSDLGIEASVNLNLNDHGIKEGLVTFEEFMKIPWVQTYYAGQAHALSMNGKSGGDKDKPTYSDRAFVLKVVREVARVLKKPEEITIETETFIVNKRDKPIGKSGKSVHGLLNEHCLERNETLEITSNGEQGDLVSFKLNGTSKYSFGAREGDTMIWSQSRIRRLVRDRNKKKCNTPS